jgi:hypothetical protein
MADMRDRLAVLDSILDEAVWAVDVTEIESRAETDAGVVHGGAWRRRPGWVALAAAVATLLLVGGSVLLVGPGSDESDVAPRVPVSMASTHNTPNETCPTDATTSVENSDPATTVLPSPIRAQWTRVLNGGDYLLVVAASQDGVFASGQGGIWHSGNGADWRQVVTKETTVTALGAGSGGVVGFGVCPAVGQSFCDLVSNWYAVDGVTWVEQRAAPLDAGEFAAVFDLVEEPGAGRFFAVGRDDAARAAVWSGEAAGYWGLEFEHPADNSTMHGIVRYDAGYIAVGGTVREEGGSEAGVAAVWLHDEGDWTADGMRWTLVSDDLDVFGRSADAPNQPAYWTAKDAAAGNFGIVVVGEVSYGTGPYVTHAAVWHTADGGQTWVLIDDPEHFADNAWITGITDTPEGLVAVGHNDGAAAMWMSADGIDWESVDLDESVFGRSFAFHDVIFHDDVLYVTGQDFESGAVWARTLGD